MEEKRDTVGKIALELMSKDEAPQSAIELEREMHKDYEAHFFECVARGKQMFPSQDFYLIVETKKERLMHNVLRNYFYPRLSCPTPVYDQAVYQYHHSDERIDFLWVLPSKDTCELLYQDRFQVEPFEIELLGFVLAFYDGTLLEKAKKLNGEEEHSPLLEKR